MPGVVLAAVFYLSGKWPVFVDQTRLDTELSAVFIIFPFLPYLLSGMGLLLAWRFNQTGMLLSAWLLGVTVLRAEIFQLKRLPAKMTFPVIAPP